MASLPTIQQIGSMPGPTLPVGIGSRSISGTIALLQATTSESSAAGGFTKRLLCEVFNYSMLWVSEGLIIDQAEYMYGFRAKYSNCGGL